MEDIEPGLLALKEVIRQRHIRTIAVPPLGSGLGGLNWQEVRSVIEKTLSDLEDVRTMTANDGWHSFCY
jgi:O-acetyl-ADP-ribose deacetylase (regulator of RNase III)